MLLSKKNILIIFSLIVISISAQHKGRPNNDSFPGSIGIESHIIPSDTLFNCFISFKIGFKNLVFIKEKGKYQSGISLTIEISDQQKIVERIIKSSSTIVDDYDLTKSKSLFLEDVVSVKLAEGEYIFNPVISIDNTDIELKLKPINVLVDSTSIFYPIVVYKDKVSINDTDLYRLVNSENAIPYSSKDFDILVPVFDQTINSVDIEILQNDRIVIKNRFDVYESIRMKIDSFDGKVVIDNDDSYASVRLFKIPYVNKMLKEGMADVKIVLGNNSEDYNIKVLWYNKPNSLRDPESAITMLKLIGKKADADILLDENEEKYPQILSDYWNKFDKDTSTAFNEVYAEFYSRIDHANENFKHLGGIRGSFSDRGIIYIKYGDPDSIEREYNENYDIVEIWEYKSVGKKIYFSDITGTGDFKRIK